MTTFTPWPCQEFGASFLSSNYGKTRALHFEMGRGKTFTSLLGLKRSSANRALAVLPPIAIPMWLREAEAHCGANTQYLATGKTKIDPTTDFLAVSYAIATKRFAELQAWAEADCTAVIADEAHALKNHQSKRTQAVWGKFGIANGAAYDWPLTGTPITRWNDDVFPFLCRADAEGMKRRLGGMSYDKFALRFCIRQQRQLPGTRFKKWFTVGNKNDEELADWMYGGDDPLAIMATVEGLPDLTITPYTVKPVLTPELKALLRQVEGMSLAEIERLLEKQERRRGAMTEALEHGAADKDAAGEVPLATIRRELGIAMVPPCLAEIKERMDAGHRILIGAWHTEVIDQLVAGLKEAGFNVPYIDGRVPMAKRTQIEADWNAKKIDGIVGQIAACGVSLNLQFGGSYGMTVEEDTSPAIMDQFYKRLHRPGQQDHVHFDAFTTEYKLHKALRRLANRKASSQSKVKAIGAEMTNERMRRG